MFSTTDLEVLAQFLVKAKTVTYASGKQDYAVKPALSGSHQLEYLDKDLQYRDIYYGGMHFIGIETVFENLDSTRKCNNKSDKRGKLVIS